MQPRLSLLLLTVCVVSPLQVAEAQLTTAQRRELTSMRRDLSRAATLVRQKKYKDAEEILDASDKKIAEIVKEAKLKPDDKQVSVLKGMIQLQRGLIAKATGKAAPVGGTVSFFKDVRPILTKNCGGCHGATGNARGGLRLNSFANLAKGGDKGAPIRAGNPAASLLMARITGVGNAKMPPGNRPRVDDDDIETITKWIIEGAKDDTAAAQTKMNANIPKPTGNETVSFTRDIAPFMVNLCIGCHRGNDPSGGLDLTTVRNMMKGGDSGEVILPGNRKESRMFRLVGGLELPRMPANQARITRTNYNNLVKWFDEGNKFDVKDFDAPIADIVPTAAELRAERLAKMSPQEYEQMRQQRSDNLWTTALRKEAFRTLEGRETFTYGNVAPERIAEVSGWAEEHIKSLRKAFGVKATPLFKGKLTVFVVKDRFGFSEFNLSNENREAPPEMTGYSNVTDSIEDAYVVVYDQGDESSSTAPGMKVNLIDHITGAFLKRDGGSLPAWAIRGTGLALASQTAKDDVYIRGLPTTAAGQYETMTQPEKLLDDGQFPPSTVGAVGYTLVTFLLHNGGPPKFGRFIAELQKGTSIDGALKAVYGADKRGTAAAFFSSFKGGKRR